MNHIDFPYVHVKPVYRFVAFLRLINDELEFRENTFNKNKFQRLFSEFPNIVEGFAQ